MSSEWFSIGDVEYRKWKSYSMSWNSVNLNNSMVVGAQYGGAIAIAKMLDVSSSASSGDLDALAIYSASGRKYSSIRWDSQLRLIGMGWTDQEDLCCCFASGQVRLYNLWGVLLRSFNILELLRQNQALAMSQGSAVGSFRQKTAAARNSDLLSTPYQAIGSVIKEAHFWRDGVMVLMDINSYVGVIQGISNPDPSSDLSVSLLKTGVPETEEITSTCIIPPELNQCRFLSVVLATVSKTLVVVDENGPSDFDLQDQILSYVSKMSLAPNGRFLACFCANGRIIVLSTTNFSNIALDCETLTTSKPKQMCWCGEDLVVMSCKGVGLAMLGAYGDVHREDYDSIVIVQESDCCRVISATSCDMFQRVPQSTEAIRRIGSTAPAALLFDAMEAYEDGDSSADDNIRDMVDNNQLKDAVFSCINAASFEFFPDMQRAYLKAASHGKTYIPSMDPDELVRTCKALRVLNSIRSEEIGLPLTQQQYARLSEISLIRRLLKRNHHFLCLKICEYLHIKNDEVLIHWACEKIKSGKTLSDDVLRDQIVDRFRPFGCTTFVDIADVARMEKRKGLAMSFLEMQQNPFDQVPLLLQMEEYDAALQRAITCADTDLIATAVLHIDRIIHEKISSQPAVESLSGELIISQEVAGLFQLVNRYPEASNMLRLIYRQRSLSQSKSQDITSYLQVTQEFEKLGLVFVGDACINDATSDNIKQLMRMASKWFGQSRDLQFQKSMCDEQQELLEEQTQLDLDFGASFTRKSLLETIYELVCIGVERPSLGEAVNRKINLLAKKFNVNEKTIWFIKIRAFSDKKQWNELQALANSKKSPIGYKPFAKAALQYGLPVAEVEQYIAKITVPEDKIDMYISIESFRKAFEVAAKTRDANKLQEIRQVARDVTLQREIDEILSRL